MTEEARVPPAVNPSDLIRDDGLYRSVFDTMAEGVVCHSATGEIVAVNPAAERIQGRSAAEMLGKTSDDPDWQAIRADGTPFPGYEHPAMQTLHTGTAYSNVIMGIVRGDGARAWISINSQPLFAAGAARPYAVIATFHDITAQVRAEEEIRDLNAKLQRWVSERTQKLEVAVGDLESFSYSVSHDLRAPLRAIDSFSRILEEEHAERLDEEGHRLISVIRRNAGRMGQLIDDILAFARTGHRELMPAIVDLAAMVRDVLDELMPAVAGRQIRVTTESLPKVCADTAELRQVLFNLLSNAIKFTRRQSVARITIRASVSEQEMTCSVSDNGVGFEPEYAHKLFGIFQRLHDAEEFEGNGIGLAIVKRIIDKHGGRIWAEGTPGVGATFHFTLPLAGGGSVEPVTASQERTMGSNTPSGERRGMPHDRPDQDDGTQNRVRRERADERIGSEPEGVQKDIANADTQARERKGENEPVRNTPPAGEWNDTSAD